MFIAWVGKIIHAMKRIESSFEEPLLFLKRVIQPDGEEYLRYLFENPTESNCWFNQETGNLDCIRILPWNDNRGFLLDGETNEREFELSFQEFVQQEFEMQILSSKNLINKQSKTNGKDQDAKLYSIILLDCLEIQKAVDSDIDFVFYHLVYQYIRQILTYVFRKFENRFPNTIEIKRVNNYYNKKKESNLTGYKLKPQQRNSHLIDFFSYLRDHGFVTKKTRYTSIYEFFQGKIPKKKIDWNKDLHELKNFIDKICTNEILDKKPGQRWKHLNNVFTFHGDELPNNWHRNNNKLKDSAKKSAIDDLSNMLRPLEK